MKKIIIYALIMIAFVGCASNIEVRSPRYFNEEVDILDYHATPYETTWTVKAKPGEDMRLIFNHEIINISFKPSKGKKEEFIFIVSSEIK